MSSVTLVICSFNGERRLPACLEAVSRLEGRGQWDILLVDNASTDGTSRMLEAFAKQSPVETRYLREEARGLGAARAAALAAARGDIVAFTDDDCYVASDFIEAVRNAFADPRIGVVGGRVTLFDPNDAPVTILTSREPRRFPAGYIMRPGEVHGACLAFRRCAAMDAGGFDPLFGAGTAFPGEDFDLGLRVLAAGWDGAYAPEVVVQHHHGRKLDASRRLIRGYRMGAGAVFTKALLDLRGLRRQVIRAWAGQQFLWLRTAPLLMFYEYIGAVRYLWARRRTHPRQSQNGTVVGAG